MNAEPPALPQFKNRKAGLITFGVFTILAGCFCALFVPLILLAPKMAAHAGTVQTPPAATIMPALLYAVMAIDFIWLGIGSAMARRWARTLLAIQSWTVFVCGLFAIGFFAVMGSTMKQAMKTAAPPNQPQMSDSAQAGLLVVMLCVVGFMFVVLPLIWALFYSGRNVKATCEARDPRPRWTDRCPAPVLAASLWLAFGAICMLGTIAYGVVPFFGVLLTGNAARVVCCFLAALWAYCAWALYRLDRRGWWIIFAALILVALSSFMTFQRHDMTEMYASMGYSKDYIATIGSFANSRWISWSTLGCTLPWLGYLLYIRKFFLRSGAAAATTE